MWSLSLHVAVAGLPNVALAGLLSARAIVQFGSSIELLAIVTVKVRLVTPGAKVSTPFGETCATPLLLIVSQ